jgi:hypothetical protein
MHPYQIYEWKLKTLSLLALEKDMADQRLRKGV